MYMKCIYIGLYIKCIHIGLYIKYIYIGLYVRILTSHGHKNTLAWEHSFA